MRLHRSLFIAGCMAAGTLAIPVLGAAPAGASTSCSASWININTGSGAEAPSQAWGHSHSTGRHYIKSRSGNKLTYWADNDGGWDGDTADTYYGVKYC